MEKIGQKQNGCCLNVGIEELIKLVLLEQNMIEQNFEHI